jgi:DNA-binding NtrC family response regulator
MESFLIIDEDEALGERLRHFFGAQGHLIETASDKSAALKKMAAQSFSVVLADRATVDTGMEGLLGALQSRNGDVVVIVMSERQKIDEAIRAIRDGATDFIEKPLNLAELDIKVARGVELLHLTQERQVLRGERDLIYRTNGIVGNSPAIRKVLDLVNRVAKTSSSVILFGETGTGKELLAGAIHFSSPRSAGAFVRVNCATLPDTLLESELFGHERGAFTGAEKLRIGRFEQANGGTIFLDEIADVSLPIQSKLLRVLQEQSFERLGSNMTINVDVRVISATNKDLAREIESGRFRSDLFYRLNVVPITVPPLGDREEDIELLAAHFQRRYATDMRKKVTRIAPDAMRMLKEYPWPGNIRELKNTIERAVLMTDSDVVAAEDLELPRAAARKVDGGKIFHIPPGGLKWQDLERELILEALEMSEWVQTRAAELLGLSKRVFNYKVRSFGITHPRWRQNK